MRETDLDTFSSAEDTIAGRSVLLARNAWGLRCGGAPEVVLRLIRIAGLVDAESGGLTVENHYCSGKVLWRGGAKKII